MISDTSIQAEVLNVGIMGRVGKLNLGISFFKVISEATLRERASGSLAWYFSTFFSYTSESAMTN